jgi:hypothetical protein
MCALIQKYDFITACDHLHAWNPSHFTECMTWGEHYPRVWVFLIHITHITYITYHPYHPHHIYIVTIYMRGQFMCVCMKEHLRRTPSHFTEGHDMGTALSTRMSFSYIYHPHHLHHVSPISSTSHIYMCPHNRHTKTCFERRIVFLILYICNQYCFHVPHHHIQM